MVTVTAKLTSISPPMTPTPGGTIDFMLCGYGSQIPRTNGVSLGTVGNICAPQEAHIPVDGSNSFTVKLISNDGIYPPGTYYTTTVRNNNGDIVQCNAYVFLESHGSYDLDGEVPFDPTLPPPPLPPLIYNQLLVVQPGPAPNFPGDQYTAWKITLNQDVPGATLSGIIPGNLYTFIIVQDSVGGHSFLFPEGTPPFGTRNMTDVCSTANSTTIQTFVADEVGILWAIAPGTWL